MICHIQNQCKYGANNCNNKNAKSNVFCKIIYILFEKISQTYTYLFPLFIIKTWYLLDYVLSFIYISRNL